MFSVSQNLHQGLQNRCQAPHLIFSLINAFGLRVYSNRMPREDALGLMTPPRADGGCLGDGSRRGGADSLSLLDRGAKVLSLGRLRESLTALRGELWASLKQSEPGSITVVLANAGPWQDRPFSRLEAMENLLGATGELSLGYPGMKAREYMKRFSGRVEAYRLEAEKLTLNIKAT